MEGHRLSEFRDKLQVHTERQGGQAVDTSAALPRSGQGQAGPAACTPGPSTRSPAETSAIPNLPETAQAIRDSVSRSSDVGVIQTEK